ncbi:uncharacterized protein LOC111411834 [Olea europaea var. sylvestris]|uniref:uncharacterized protein LOC111411834 n=1 Tax=Olea europaea var. sylvestris TaxID=158386 RepID=UPI000C1D642A|nr:uncharacterized protein LOC111411834 [Olea europaea var. sylvestris]
MQSYSPVAVFSIFISLLSSGSSSIENHHQAPTHKNLILDTRNSAFQEKVWKQLREEQLLLQLLLLLVHIDLENLFYSINFSPFHVTKIREADISRLSFAVEFVEESYGRVKGQDVVFEPAKLLWIIQRDFLQGKSVQEMIDKAL